MYHSKSIVQEGVEDLKVTKGLDEAEMLQLVQDRLAAKKLPRFVKVI
jgi:hypothetical protein